MIPNPDWAAQFSTANHAKHANGFTAETRRRKESNHSLLHHLPPMGVAGFDMAKTTRIAHSCPMKITEDVRKYAAEQGIAEEEALKKGMEEKSKEFVEKGAEVYAKA